MKKLTLLLVTCLLILVSVFTVTAADEKFEMTIKVEGNVEAVSVGSEVKITVSCDNITDKSGLMTLDAVLEYDTDVFELKDGSVKADELSDWTVEVTPSSGKLTLFATDDTNEGDAPVKESGEIKFSATFKVKDSAKKSSNITITPTDALSADYESISGKSASVTLKIKQRLSAPKNPTFTDGLAKWDAVENADSYIIQLYKDGKEYGDQVSTDKTEYNFASTIKEGGKYSFRVTADSEKAEFDPSEESAQSTFYTKKGTLTAPSITVAPDYENGGIKYQITDKNADSTVSQYIIEVYEKGSQTPVISGGISTSKKADNIKLGSDALTAGKEYCVTVAALAEDSDTYTDSQVSALSASAKAVVKAKSIEIKTQPKLEYVEGEKLNLSEMVVVITLDDGTAIEAKFADFGDYGLYASLDDDVVLSIKDHNEKKITVKLGDISAATSSLSVQTSTCAHTETKKEHLDPTCGKEGYDRVVCTKCNVIVSSTPIPVSGEHTYSEWLITVQPTPNFAGQQRRICSVCNKVDEEIIPPLSDSSDTTDGNTSSDTAADTTDNDVTTTPQQGDDTDVGKPSGMSDLSKVFLIILIVVFSLILIFIVGAVWLENRKNKARRSRRENNRNRR